MALFSKAKRSRHSLAVLDIDSASVGGALVFTNGTDTPTICYTKRLSIEARDTSGEVSDLLRTLDQLGEYLVTEGGPALRQLSGSGHIDTALISLGTPWQETKIRKEVLMNETPFLFTHSLLHNIVSKDTALKDEHMLVSQSVVATVLNGYSIEDPFGKKATRVELSILSATLDQTVAKSIETRVRSFFHTRRNTLSAYAPIAYRMVRELFPHEKNFLVIDVSLEGTDIAMVKRNVLANVGSLGLGSKSLLPKDTNGSEWLDALSKELARFSSEDTLPRTIFLITSDAARDDLGTLLNSASLKPLWLSDSPLTIIPITPSHLSARVQTRGTAEPDIYLLLLALYAAGEYEGR